MVTGLILSLLAVTADADMPGNLQITLLKAKPAVVQIYSVVKGVIIDPGSGKQVWNDFVSGGAGSGFIVNPDGYVVTNGHVVADVHESNEFLMKAMAVIKFIQVRVIPEMEAQEQKTYSDTEKRQMMGKLYDKYKEFKVILKKELVVVLSNKKVYPAEVKEYSPAINPLPGGAGTLVQDVLPGVQITTKTGKDVAILKIEDRNFPTVRLGNSGDVQIGERVHVIGYPSAGQSEILSQESKMVDQTINTGTISGSKIDIKGTPMIQTDVNIIWGNSGGPCINSNGHVIGVVSYVGLAKGQAFSGFNWLVPVNTVLEFIRAAGIDAQKQSLFDTEWEKALNFFSKGKNKDAEKAIQSCLVYMPDQPDARKLLLSIKESEPQGTSVGWLIVFLVGVGIVAAVIVFLFVGKKKKPSKQPHPKVDAQPTQVSPVSTARKEKLGRLVGRGKPIQDKVYEIETSGVKIGRISDKNDLVIDDEEVSREHAWIGPEGDKMMVRDLSSTNGTFINSVSKGQIEKAEIHPGDFVFIGKAGKISLLYQKG